MPTVYISFFCKGGTGNVGVEERSFNLAGSVEGRVSEVKC